MSVITLIVLLAGGAAVLSFFPASEKWPLLGVSCLLLTIACLILTGTH